MSMRSPDHQQAEHDRLCAEDLVAQAGVRLPLGSVTMTEAAIRDFALQWDPLPIHVGDRSAFGGVIASGVHTLAVFQRLAVDAVYSSWAVVAGRAIRELVLPRPVFPGDVLTGWVRVVGAAPPRNGRVKLDVEGHLENQEGSTVLSLHLDSYVHTRASLATPAQ